MATPVDLPYLRAALLLALAALPVAAKPPLESAVPKGQGWFCPDQKVRNLTVECLRTKDECERLVDTALGSLGGERPTCKASKKAYCVSWQIKSRARPPEAICHASLAACSKDRRDMAGVKKLVDLSECAEHD